MTQLTALQGLTAADVMHPRITSLGPETTVAELRAWFAASGSRRLAVFVQDGRYAGAIAAGALDVGLDPEARAIAHASADPLVAPDAPATAARDLALGVEARRVPVVDEAGTLLGVVAVDEARERFCGVG